MCIVMHVITIVMLIPLGTGSVQRSCDQRGVCTSERRSNQIGGCGLAQTVIVTVELVR